MTNSSDITQHVELICLKGCTAVREIINDYDKDKICENISTLPHDAQRAIMAELKSIMAVYDKQQDTPSSK